MEIPADVAVAVEATMMSSSAINKRLDFETVPSSSVKETPVLGDASKDGNPKVVEQVKVVATPKSSFQPSPLPKKPASMLNPRNCVPPISPEQQLQSIKNKDTGNGGESEDEEDKKIIKKEKAKAKAKAKAKGKKAQAKQKASSKPGGSSTKSDDTKTAPKRNNSKTKQKANGVETEGCTDAKKPKVGSSAGVEPTPGKPVCGKPKAKKCKTRKLRKLDKVAKAASEKGPEDPVGTLKRKQLANADGTASSSAASADNKVGKKKASRKATSKEKVVVNNEDPTAERKARYSRKSAAYHGAKRQAIKEGLDEEAALAKAKEVPWFLLNVLI